MWGKSLLLAGMTGLSLPARVVLGDATSDADGGDSAKDTAKDSPEKRSSERLESVHVIGHKSDDSLKAETQSTSSKMNMSLRETPQSVTVITQESLKARQVIDFGQALETSAGVNQFTGAGAFGGQAGFGFNQVTIRGILIDADNDFREDGFIANSYFALPDMAIFDRIEVIKGPNSVAYGRGSAGGLINRIRKKPLEEFQSDVELTAGAFNTWRADVDVTGPLVADGSIAGRLVGAYGREGSFVDGVETHRTLLAPSLAWQIAPGTRVLVEGLFQRDNFIPSTGFPLVEAAPGRFDAPNIPRTLYVGVPTAKQDRWNIYSGVVQLEQSLSDHWLATLRINHNRSESPIRTDRYAYGLSPSGDTLLIADDFQIDRDIWAGEFRVNGDFDVAGIPVTTAFGAEMTDMDYHRRGAYAYLGYANIYQRNFSDPPAQPLSPGSEYVTSDKTQGYYLQLQVRPLERLSVLAGIRHDRTHSSFDSITFVSYDDKVDHATSGRIGVTYDLSKNISAYGLYGRSFSPVLSADRLGNLLAPETGKIIEAGLKTEWFDKKFGANIAGYRIDRMNIPVGVAVGPAEQPYSISSGLQRSDGFEIEITGRPLPGLSVSGAYNWLRSNFKDPQDPLYGTRPGGSAPYQVGLFSTYEIQSGPLKGLGGGATVFSIGERGLSTFQSGATLGGYTRVDVNLFYKGLPGYEFALSVRNVADRRYVEGADRSSAYAQFGSPTAWLFSLRRHFGG